MHRHLTRVQLALAACFTLVAAFLLVRQALFAPEVFLLPPGQGAAWIADPMRPHTHGMWIEKANPRARLFERSFSVPASHGAVQLQARALGDLRIFVNGHALDLSARDPRQWRTPVVSDVTALLEPGDNRVRAEVRSARGAALLELRIDGLAEPVATDERWLAARDGDPFEAARLADDRVPLPDALSLPSPGPSLRAHAILFLGLFALGAGASAWARGRAHAPRRAPLVAGLAVGLFWIALFATKVLRIPATIGFDAAGHTDYVRWILAHGSLPLASSGFSTYHPPLYHAVTAGLLAVAQPTPGSVVERAVLGLLPALSGLGMAIVSGRVARIAAPRSPGIEAGAILAGGLLPMNVALGAYVSNEAPHAFLASLAILATLAALVAPQAPRRRDVAIGALLGAGLLAKYTSAVLVPVLLGALAVKRVVAERTGFARAASGAALGAGVALAIGGWVYLRNWLHFGDPFVWNLDVDPTRTWWQLPGFRTPGYFLRFGDALVHPWFVGFQGFWDSLYTTFWGDGLLGGASGARAFHGQWRLDLMAAGFALALPATALLFAGWLRTVRFALGDRDPGRRLGFSLVAFLPVLFLVSLLGQGLALPFWSVNKAFYALCATPLFALFLALGFESLDRRTRSPGPARGARAALWGWAATLLGATVLAYLG